MTSNKESKEFDDFEKLVKEYGHLAPKDLLKHVNELIGSRRVLSKKLADIISNVEDQELAMKITKGTLASTGVVGTILLFTPFAPLGAVMVGGSAAGGTVVSITDFIITAVREGNVEELLKKDNEMAKDLIKDFEEINSLAAIFVEKKIATNVEEGCKKALVFSVVMGFINTASTIISQYKDFKVLFTNGIRFLKGADKQALGFISRAGGIMTSSLLILDFVMALLIDNPAKVKAQQAKSKIDESIDSLQKIENIIEQLKKFK